MKFKVRVEQDEDGFYVAECLALPGCVTQGRTESEALDRLKEAIDAWLEVEAEKETARRPPEGTVTEIAA